MSSLRLFNLARYDDLVGSTALFEEGFGDSGSPPHIGFEILHRRLRRRTVFGMSQSYVDLLSGQDVSQTWINFDETNQHGGEAANANPTQPELSGGPKRKTNFSDEEDKALTSAWLAIGMDPIVGNQQKGNTYWTRMHAEFESNLGIRTDRTPGSLAHRWALIYEKVSKWSSCYEAIERKNPSGATIDDKNGACQEMFKKLNKKSFTWMDCWLILRHQAKWNSTLTSKKAKRSESDSPESSTPHTLNSINLEDDTPEEVQEMNKPIGRKAAKGKKRSGMEDESSSFLAAMDATQNSRFVCEQKKDERFDKLMSMEQERLEIERRKEALERSKEDRSIMDVDLTRLSGSSWSTIDVHRKK